MADSEKSDSSTKEAKAKTSLLDEGFSEDFLSSWKSMSATGGDDMDFNFEPVSKGKKKAFDFGMDMDFSLDDAFGKMSSFKIDMPDLDFSSSPKKSTKPKDSKENHLDKQDNFNFSFDFNGLGDFSLDAPSAKGGKSTSREKKNKSDGSEFEDLPKRVTNDKKGTVEDSISKGPAVCEDSAFSKTEDLVIDDIPSVNCASKSTALSYPVQLTELDKNKSSSEKELTDNNPSKIDHQTHQEGEAFTNKSCSPGKEGILDPISVDSPPQSIGSSIPADSAEVHISSGTEKTMSSLSTEDKFQPKEEKSSSQSHIQFKDMDLSTNTPLMEASVQPNASEGLRISSPDRKVSNRSSEGGIVAGELPAAVALASATEKPVLDKSSQECSIIKMKVNDGKNELGNSGNLGRAKLLLGTVAPCATCDTKALSSSASSSAGIQIPVLKVSSAPIGSGPSAGKAMLMNSKVPSAMNSKLSVKQATKDGGRTELSSSEDNKDFSTHIGAVDRSKSYGGRDHNEKKSDDYPSSFAKESIKSDSVLERSENIAAANSPPRDEEDTLIRKDSNDMSVNTEQPEGSKAKSGLPSPECEKMVINVKPSGLKNPSLTPPEEGTTFGNQEQGKHKDKISCISSFQKLNIARGNKLASQRIEKKTLALPSLKLTSTATDKQPVTPTKQRKFVSLGNFEKSIKLQVASKMASPVSAEKQTPSNLSWKRKLSEAADVDPAKLHMPKRVSPNESRMTKASARGLEEGDPTQGNFLEESRKNVSAECTTPKYDFDQEAKIEALQFSMMIENDENIEKAEACAKELDNMCNMLKKKHEEAKELLVRALVNNNYLLLLNHPLYEEKIRAVQRIASRLMTKEL